jgi:hypothetical protein
MVKAMAVMTAVTPSSSRLSRRREVQYSRRSLSKTLPINIMFPWRTSPMNKRAD